MRRDLMLPLLVVLAITAVSAIARSASAAPGPSNQPCLGSHDCPYGEYCSVTDMRGTCLPLPKSRVSCEAHPQCGPAAYCDPMHLICVPDRARPPSSIGKPCDPEMEYYCGDEAACCEIMGEFYCQVDCP